jgi:2-C-methyl-D-erythritol 4-phosphate cytidylyltransferase
MNSAIIVAGGRGSRFNSEIPKQFIEILGKPVIVHTLERFERCPDVDEIVLVLPQEFIEKFKEASTFSSIIKLKDLVPGGATRSESVSNGLAAIDPLSEVVAIHDGARPLVSADEISRTIDAARMSGAACLVSAVTDTIKEVCDGVIVRTRDRVRLRRALTPQAFRVQIIREALEATGLDESITDDSMAVERLGHKVVAVDGNPRNIKVTHREDLAIVEIYLKGGIE